MSIVHRNAAIDVEISRLGDLPIGTLRQRFTDLCGKASQPCMGRDLLIRAIAYRMQEDAEGGLRPALRRRIAKLATELRRTGQVRIDTLRPAKTGTRLIREWQGQTHEVTVTEDGFVYRDRRYRSLSPIAREITGTRWSGPAFFGLRDRNRAV